MSDVPLLTRTAQVEQLACQLARETVIAVDLEADSMHSYQEKVCLLQFSWQDQTALVDPLAGADLAALRPLMADGAITKIFHAADYDIRCLARDCAIEVRGLFDTMVACQLLGEERVGLADVLKKYFAIELDKSCQRADWSQRPLPEKMLRYAAEDTRHLQRLLAVLRPQLEEKGRLAWAREEFALLERARFRPQEGPAVLRFKGAAVLPPAQLAVLQTLLEWRETEACRRDCPPYKVIGNRELLALAQQQPTDEAALDKLVEVPARLRQRYGKALLRQVVAGQAVPAERWPRFARGERQPRDPAMEARLARLKKWRAAKAEQLGLEPGILINNASLEQLAAEQPRQLSQLEGLKDWQKTELAAELLPLVQN
ncbi:ribonuclease D [Desulfuromonas thiophila]|uniref:Ribonuclease D n=1 Tax=Desulfuromonas thiophila TaxID=57664 RepID=A0A1G6ZU17_9BACT|nr:HRDC domain-containing protein [Desulfuromonas thiophila]SDE06039.1 ribonuclease D [Desulfuromonas thiophila]